MARAAGKVTISGCTDPFSYTPSKSNAPAYMPFSSAADVGGSRRSDPISVQLPPARSASTVRRNASAPGAPVPAQATPIVSSRNHFAVSMADAGRSS